ncbi:virulence protein [Ruminococcus flavefaciens]|uniref:virulence protein n=1 Tax=Ruminococcus flavefaciens TaxID=1265 RepID=UPI001563CAD3|nr:virulence protein [Ruminococcus flavefaciens]
MNIRFNIEKSQRKALAQKIGELADMDVRYCGVPSCAYEIGFFTLSKDAVLSFADRMDTEVIENVLDGLEKAGYTAEDEPEALTISMPRDFFTEQSMNNLLQLIANKETLLKHALETESLAVNECEETIEFPWFTIRQDGDADAYAKFITMFCEFAKNLQRVVNKPDASDNEKYAFRCFLLRLGMIGADYKAARKVLLRNLTGSSAFRHGKPEGGADDAVSE